MLAVFDCIFIRFNCLSCILIYFIQLSFMYFSSSFIGFSSVSFDCLSCVFHLSHLFFPCFIRLSSHLLDWFLLCQHRIDNIQSASTVCILEGGYSACHKLGPESVQGENGFEIIETQAWIHPHIFPYLLPFIQVDLSSGISQQQKKCWNFHKLFLFHVHPPLKQPFSDLTKWVDLVNSLRDGEQMKINLNQSL